MSNKPFDRTIIRPLEKPLAEDINQGATNFDQTLRFYLQALFTDPETEAPADGFLHNGFKASAQTIPDMTVTVHEGLGFQAQTGTTIAIDSVVGLNDLETYKPLPLLAPQLFTVPVAPGGSKTRIDIIEVKAESLVTDATTRQVFAAGVFIPGSVNKTHTWALDGRAASVNAPAISTAPLSYVVGVEASPGVVPPTTPGYIKIAEVFVDTDVTTIEATAVTDFRELLSHRVSKIHWPANSGFNLSGTASPAADGSVVLAAVGTWVSSIGSGLEAGDIIEDIVVVVEKKTVVSSFTTTAFSVNSVDLDTLVPPTFVQSIAATPASTTLALATISHRAQDPAIYPLEWKEGYACSLQSFTSGEADAVHSIYAVVRRPINKRDS